MHQGILQRIMPILAVAVVTLAAGCGGPIGPITSFSADHVTVSPGQPELIGRVFVAPQKVRVGRVPMVYILREDLGVMWMMVPERKVYHEMPRDEAPLDAMMREVSQEQIIAEELVTETVNGFLCRKLRIKTSVEILGTRHEGTAVVWTTPALAIPIRSKTEDGTVSELRELRPGTQPEELFEIPQGYEKTSKLGLFAEDHAAYSRRYPPDSATKSRAAGRLRPIREHGTGVIWGTAVPDITPAVERLARPGAIYSTPSPCLLAESTPRRRANLLAGATGRPRSRSCWERRLPAGSRTWVVR